MNLLPINVGKQWVQGDRITPVTNNVRLTRAFSIDAYQITADEYATVREWALSNGYDLNNGEGNGQIPITRVTWFDAIKWCNAVSEMNALIPCYTINKVVYRTGEKYSDCDFNAGGYRLPTEAEWEYIARLEGTLSGDYKEVNSCRYYNLPCNDPGCVFCTAPIVQDPETRKWVRTTFPEPVGSRDPIGGLYDTIGNVLEWCWDVFVDYTPTPSIIDDPVIKVDDHRRRWRIIRGAAYGVSDFDMKPASRQACNAGFKLPHVGFRVAR